MVRASLLLTGSFLVFWISVLGSTGALHGWRGAAKALTPQAFEHLQNPRPSYAIPRLVERHEPSDRANTLRWSAEPKLADTLPHVRWDGGLKSSRRSTAGRAEAGRMSSLLYRAVPRHERAREMRVSVVKARSNPLCPTSRAHWLPRPADPVTHSAQYRKRALALRRASGCAARTLVAPEELTASAILPEEPNGVTSMIAISTVLVFATFTAF
ncbi:hypothetical protein IWW50_000897 [Coemansia erecta]|nr:hypothetical protein IWW50_000897 [Coemansia erecta]